MSSVKILKYQVAGNGELTNIICRKSKILDIQLQGYSMMCWIETRDDLPEVATSILSIGTGWDMPSDFMDGANFIKTVQDACGYVWHFYEVSEHR